jgi:phage-related tail fiber protein
MVFTDDGRNLLAKAQTGVQLKFTRIAVGDGMLNGQDATKFKHLLDEVLSLSISEIIYSGSGQAVLKSVLSNESLSKGFYWREIGVFATDPQLGEILYAYTNANDGEIYVPDKATNIYTTPLNLNLYISNASNVTAVIDSSLVYATKQDIADIKSGVITVGMAAKVSNALTFSGGSTMSFDGSTPQTVKIPSKPDDIGAATAAQGAKADSAVQSSQVGVANGVATLDSGGKIPKAQLPATGGYVRQAAAPTDTSLLWMDSGNGDIVKYYNGTAWVPVPATWG